MRTTMTKTFRTESTDSAVSAHDTQSSILYNTPENGTNIAQILTKRLSKKQT